MILGSVCSRAAGAVVNGGRTVMYGTAHVAARVGSIALSVLKGSFSLLMTPKVGIPVALTATAVAAYICYSRYLGKGSASTIPSSS